MSIYTQSLPSSLMQRAQKIRLLICDVDGVLTDGKVYLGNSGEELKAFNIKDGLGIKLLQANGIEVALITGRQSDLVDKRAKELGIAHVYQNKKNKVPVYNELKSLLGLQDDAVAYIGDDWPDLPLIKCVGLGACVADAHPALIDAAFFQTNQKGGSGAVRELCDLLLLAQNRYQESLNDFLQIRL